MRDGAAVRALVARLGGSTSLVNCAGVIRRGAEHEPDVFADRVDINLTGTMRVCAAAGRAEGARRRIVNTASMLSFFGGGLVPGYSASKGGVASSPSAWRSPMRPTASASTRWRRAGSRPR